MANESIWRIGSFPQIIEVNMLENTTKVKLSIAGDTEANESLNLNVSKQGITLPRKTAAWATQQLVWSICRAGACHVINQCLQRHCLLKECWLLSLNSYILRQGQTLASNARPLPGVGSTSPPPSGQLSFQASDFGAIRFHTILVRVRVLGADCSVPVRTSLRPIHFNPPNAQKCYWKTCLYPLGSLLSLDSFLTCVPLMAP